MLSIFSDSKGLCTCDDIQLWLWSGGLQEALRDTKKANLGAAEEGPGMPTDSWVSEYLCNFI